MPQPARRNLTLRLAVALLALALTIPATAGNTEQRHAFRHALKAARNGHVWRTEAKGLQDYSLYPWLPAAEMEHNLHEADTAHVQAYLDRYAGMVPAQDLRRHYLHELFRRKDWSGFLQLYRPDTGTALQCKALRARLKQGETLDFEADIATLWDHAYLPNACTPVQKWAHKQGLLTRQRLWHRIDKAVDAGRASTVSWLAKWLHGADHEHAQHLAKALRAPVSAAAGADTWPDTTRNRQAATLALKKMAPGHPHQAANRWSQLRSHYSFSDAQTHAIRAATALYAGVDFDDDALDQLAGLPSAAQTDATRAWRVRVALVRKDWKKALQALNALTDEQKNTGEWRYLRARVQAKLGHEDKARKLYQRQAQEPTYYGFLAADRADLPYALCPRNADPANTLDLAHKPALQRAFELYAVDMYHDARRVWSRAMADADTTTQHAAAYLATRRGWYDRAIRTFNHGDLKRLYTQRFPLAHENRIETQSADAGIDTAWALGIIRAESAWMPDAHSGADARGLMQLLPTTARRVSRRHHIKLSDGLYDPDTNIALGTHYLAHVASRFDGAPYLATAAYNAGPSRVDQWRNARPDLAPDLFVATIPYHETRHYVMRVLAYSVIYDWRLHGTAAPLEQRLPHAGDTYAPPDDHTPRKQVKCPASDAASDANT